MWAKACDYERDFRGRVKYLGIAACQWLRMRLGVDTVKPDVHTHNFVKHAVGRQLSDASVVKVIEAAARAMNVRARRLDGAIWEHQRGGPGTIWGAVGHLDVLGRSPQNRIAQRSLTVVVGALPERRRPKAGSRRSGRLGPSQRTCRSGMLRAVSGSGDFGGVPACSSAR